MVNIDTPGSDTYLMRLAHSMADTLVTPLNDSFVDFDVLGTQRHRRKPLCQHGARDAPPAPSRRRQADRLAALGSRNRRLVGDGIVELSPTCRI
jgi:chromosome partitioning protein